ncbi:MAG: alpha-L-glutamate ligase-like protein [Legionellales bacterium RIFCSPHIGHO2_12_FULL_35_11]|nr:MAG: alpha-L-glutamate ligase-like protein [Legionellales bacterium RIFCSPHIGHO2_12_FULL_35_11]
MINLYKKLLSQGVLSMNRRNGDYVLRYNDRKLYPLVDDKLKTKQLALKSSISVPDLYETIDTEHQVKRVEQLLKPYSDFVVKPARGSGGDGILVITNSLNDRYRQINGRFMTVKEMKYHLSSLLSGAYSIGNHPDYAIIERRVIVSPVFSEVSYEGVPDIRIIILLGYPAMAMLRLPTRQSDGKANLHQGAIGVGINLATGITLRGVHHNDIISAHPDTMNDIKGITIPYWEEILQIAAGCYELTGLGYLGVDIVIDKDQGPLMLELNARPGLNIQIANGEGALKRYQLIEQKAAAGKESIANRIEFSRKMFA